VTGFGIQLAVGAFFWCFRNEAGREYHKTLAHCLALVVAEIGDPPNHEKAAALAAARAFNLRYIAPRGGFSTREEVPGRLPPRMRRFQPQPGVRRKIRRLITDPPFLRLFQRITVAFCPQSPPATELICNSPNRYF
jgi:hypothetical protein